LRRTILGILPVPVHSDVVVDVDVDVDVDRLLSLCCDYILDNGLGIDSGGAIAPINNCPHIILSSGFVHSTTTTNTNTNTTEANTKVNANATLVAADDIPNNIFELPCQYFKDQHNKNNNDRNNDNDNNDNDNDNDNKKKTKMKISNKFKDEIEYSTTDNNKDQDGIMIASCPKGENWFCLHCGGIYCSRYINGHGVKHYEESLLLLSSSSSQPSSSSSSRNNNSCCCCVMVGLADLSVWCHQCSSYLQTHHPHTYLNSIINKLQHIKFD